MVIFAKDIIAWTGKGINKLKNCESYELYGKIPVCKGMEKFSSILLEQPTETGRMFDNGLFLAFVFGFFSFLVTSIYTVFVEDSKSLKEISNKVIRTTDTIVTVLRTMWTLKVSKESNSALEEELREIEKPTLLIPTTNLQAPLEKIKEEINTKESKESEEIDFVEQIEFSLNDEWHPPKDEENNQKFQVEKPTTAGDMIDHQHDQNENLAKPIRRYSPAKSRSSRLSEKDPNLHVLYEKKAEPYSLHSRYDESSVSHVENFRDSRWSVNSNGRQNKKFNNKPDLRRPSPDFRTINRQPSRISHLSYSSKKFRSNDNSNNELPVVRGIFDQRRREKAKARRFNSTERNSTVLNWEVKSMTVNIKPRKPRNEKSSRETRVPMTEFST